MAEFKLKRGFNIKIAGKSEKTLIDTGIPEKVAVQPIEFPGIKPRLSVKVGDTIKIGTALFADKAYPEIHVVSPVSGKVLEINRGERRILNEIVIENDKKDDSEPATPLSEEDLQKKTREELVTALLKSGMWPLLRQRPYSKVARPDGIPRDIFISGMDTSPLAADPNFLLQGEEESFRKGILVLQKLTNGDVYLSLDGKADQTAPAFQNTEGVITNKFSGPHPAGNVGVHIHHIKPVRSRDIVWYISAYAVSLLGKFLATGAFQRERIVATAGPSLTTRQYYKTMVGMPLSMLIAENDIQGTTPRFIAGNILSGRKINAKGHVGFYNNLLTVLPEGAKGRKLLGYFRFGFKTPSFSNTHMSTIFPRKEYDFDTLMHGGKRAFVQTGDYERVLPMDILPVFLMKSIMVDDIEEMLKLGILELDEEDLALCTYICLSKTDFGAILRRGLNLMEKEG